MLNKTDFLYENLMIQNNVIFSAAKCNVEKLVFIGSSCIYPKETPQPIEESSLLKGPLEETNEGYALAKIAGLKLCKYINEELKKVLSLLCLVMFLVLMIIFIQTIVMFWELY